MLLYIFKEVFHILSDIQKFDTFYQFLLFFLHFSNMYSIIRLWWSTNGKIAWWQTKITLTI